MLSDTMIDSVLDLPDDELFVGELDFIEIEALLQRITEGPVACSEIGFQNSQQGACCCYNDTTPQTFGTCA